MSLVTNLLLQSPSWVTLLGTVVLLLVFYLLSPSPSSKEKRNEPPGPRPLPLLGNLLVIYMKRPDLHLYQLSKKYGSVFKIYLGTSKVVVLVGYKTIKEALVKHTVEFGDRAIDAITRDLNHEHGVTFANGESWKEMRRFALTSLRDHGMGKRASEEKILEETHKLIQVIEKHEGKAFDTTKPINYAISNIISFLVYGRRFEYDDTEYTTMVDQAHAIIHSLGSTSVQLYNIFPWLGKWVANRKYLIDITEAKRKHMKHLIDSLKDTLTPDMCRGFVDTFLARLQKQEESGKADAYFHSENLMATQANLFSAGTVTTSTTLRWALLIMAKYPQIQDQVQEELSQVIGTRQVLVEDRKNLPFTDAVIHETQRFINLVPLSFTHVTSQDVTFRGFFIKKGTTVIPLLTSALFDEDEWETPHKFNPGHFLDEEGKFSKQAAFIPFSAGRRVCAGESLAKMELFLFFSSLLQRFRFTPPPGVTEEELDLNPHVGLLLSPLPHQLCAVSRF